MLAAVCCALGACTPVADYTRAVDVDIRVEADSDIAAQLPAVLVVVESHAAGASLWSIDGTQHFTPRSPDDWPLELRLTAQPYDRVFKVTATARDHADAIIARAQLIADPEQRSIHTLQLRFDRECIRRSQPCEEGLTCAFGECVDAHRELSERPDAGIHKTPEGASDSEPAGAEPSRHGDPCGMDAARTCSSPELNRPLLCEQGVWQAQPACGAADGCDTSNGPNRGTCVPIAEECRTRSAGDVFCDAQSVMHACTAHRVAEVRPCGQNERCVEQQGRVQCACLPGFQKRDQVCREAVDCTGMDQGGCDALTVCMPSPSGRTCSECPAGYTGSGATGCSPLLRALRVEGYPLEPEFRSSQTAYQIRVPFQAQSLTLTASAAPEVQLSVNGSALRSDQPWTTPTLRVGSTKLQLTVISQQGHRRDYELLVERQSAQQIYLKASNGRTEDRFGTGLATFGNTLVVGAPFESGSSGDVNGPAGTRNAGAVYVYVFEAGRWTQQAYLKSSEIVVDDLFGFSVGIWEDRIAVGSIGNNAFIALRPSSRSGSVHTFVRRNGIWTLEARLTPDTAAHDTNNAFGLALALQKDALLVGSPHESDGGMHSGAAYLFEWSGAGWKQQQRFKAPVPDAESRFGGSLAFDGQTVAIGASQEDVGPTNRAGAAYLYSRRASGGFELLQRVISPIVREAAQFGFALAVFGETLAISAPHNPLELPSNYHGELYLYDRAAAGEFRPAGMLQAMFPRTADNFGCSLALTASQLLVGASGEAGTLTDPNAGAASGAAYLYTRDPRAPALIAHFKASNADLLDGFGGIVALSETQTLVSAIFEDGGSRAPDQNPADNSSSDRGAVYSFH